MSQRQQRLIIQSKSTRAALHKQKNDAYRGLFIVHGTGEILNLTIFDALFCAQALSRNKMPFFICVFAGLPSSRSFS